MSAPAASDLDTYDAAWLAAKIGKTADWVTRHIDEIPHVRIGRTPRFTEQHLRDYLAAEYVPPRRMVTTGHKRRGV